MSHPLLPTTIALSILGALIGLPTLAQATPKPAVLMAQTTAAPQIDNLTVNPVSQLTPGTELVFTLQGTPNAQATLTIGTVARNLPMQETQPGVYEGRYTIRSQDQITANTPVRANLQQNDRLVSTRLQQPLLANAATTNQVNGANTNTASSLRIDNFTTQPVSQLAPGTELRFTLTGTPNAQATYTINGIAYNQPMREVSSGTYEGSYVIRRQDYFPSSGTTVTASLQANNQTVRAQLDQSLVANSGTSTTDTSTTQLPIEILSPANNAKVSGTVEVKGRSAPNATLGVKVQAQNSVAGLIGFNRDILNQTIQADAQGNFSFSFNPSVPVQGTRYQISLDAQKGNQTNTQTLVLFQQ